MFEQIVLVSDLHMNRQTWVMPLFPDGHMLRSVKAKDVAIKRLLNVINGQAPQSLIDAATAMHKVLTGKKPHSEDEFTAAQDMLADAIADMPGTIDIQLDFIGVLHGDDAQVTRHSWRNVGAALRHKRSGVEHPLVDADFPSGHPAPLFALAYWGGMAKWSAGSAERAQHPRGHWMVHANCVSAIVSVSVQHPGKPITHALLHACGLHRLAMMTSASELESLAAEAGLDRGLSYKPTARWTAERVMDTYADACRRAGITLSTSALTELGGEACSLKFYVRRHYATFEEFQKAVVARHTDIQPPDQPTAKDGTRLDSWSEVVVHNALRNAFPDARIEHHVMLPGEQLRSADFVVEGIVWIEVLGIARAAMTATTSNRQAKYAKQWMAKSARYVALGIEPVLFEPDDIADHGRLVDRINEVAAKLGSTPVASEEPAGKHVRFKGYWNFETLIAAVNEVAQDSGKFPTHEAFVAAGFGHACNMLKKPGVRLRVGTILKLTDPNRKRRLREQRNHPKRRSRLRR